MQARLASNGQKSRLVSCPTLFGWKGSNRSTLQLSAITRHTAQHEAGGAVIRQSGSPRSVTPTTLYPAACAWCCLCLFVLALQAHKEGKLGGGAPLRPKKPRGDGTLAKVAHPQPPLKIGRKFNATWRGPAVAGAGAGVGAGVIVVAIPIPIPPRSSRPFPACRLPLGKPPQSLLFSTPILASRLASLHLFLLSTTSHPLYPHYSIVFIFHTFLGSVGSPC